MSATLDVAPLRAALADCALLDCPLRQHPLRIDYLQRPDERPLERQVRAGLQRLLAEPDDDGGGVLVFLPGAAAIERCRRLLDEAPLPGRPAVLPLYGALPAAAQDRALAPADRRRVVLATNIAETSLTVPGISAVIDSGWVKRLRADPSTGLERLQVERVSRAAADQRAGRAGRLGPGRALRLWTRAEQAGLVAAETPELLRCDLAPVLLAALAFQPGPPAALHWLDAPPPAGLDAALALLRSLGAVQPDAERLTRLGRRLAGLPVHPRLGALLAHAADAGRPADGALLAALLAERDILARGAGGTPALPDSDSDLLLRRDWFAEAAAAGFSAAACRRLGLDRGALAQVDRARAQLERLAGRLGGAQREPGGGRRPKEKATAARSGAGAAGGESGAAAAGGGAGDETTETTGPQRVLRRAVLAGFADRVCRRRAAGSDEALMVGGAGVRLDAASGVRRAPLFVALEAEAGPRGLHAVARVRQAHAIEAADLAALFPQALSESRRARFDPQRGAVVGVVEQRFADLLLEEQVGVALEPAAAAAELARAAGARFEEVFRPDAAGRRTLARLRLAARLLGEADWPRLDEDGLRALLAEQCSGRRSLAELGQLDWSAVLLGRLDWRRRRLLDAELPERITVPSGRRVAIDYSAADGPEAAPVLAVKLQELFGLEQTPRIARGRVALLLHLLAPNGRPVQVTRDLASFWRQVYPEVRRDLRGRYPKHPWPEDPLSAQPTAQTRRRSR
jgi:ATP-dependent helicase HrpB